MKIFILVLSLLLLVGCQSQPVRSEGRVQHVVMVWFKEGVSKKQVEEVIAASYALKKQIPLIRDIHVGRPIPSERKIVDDSFDIGLIMEFESKQDLKSYVTHPEHKHFVEQYVKGKVERLQVYDF